MPRKGRLFEVLITHLQQFSADEGVEIQSPELFYDEDRNKIGEVDVTLRSKVGTASSFIGIECRDRPRDGPQGVDWIREIAGKKNDLKIDKMVAVSSSGFTAGAKRLATKNRFDLISIEDLDTIDVSDWLMKIVVAWAQTTYGIPGPFDFKIVRGYNKDIIQPNSIVLPCLDRNDGKGLLSIREVLEHEIRNLLDAIGPNQRDEPKHVRVNIPGPFDLVFLGTQTKIARIIVPVNLNFIDNSANVLLGVCHDVSNDEVIGLTGSATISNLDGPFIVSVVVRRNRKDPSKLDMRANFLTPEYEPYKMPEGTMLRLYGHKRA